MPKSPALKKYKPSKSTSAANRRKQKFAIWSYYKKKNASATKGDTKGKK